MLPNKLIYPRKLKWLSNKSFQDIYISFYKKVITLKSAAKLKLIGLRIFFLWDR